MAGGFVRHARTVSLLTMLSRIFGAGAVTSAFFFAFMIPNLFRRLFGEGALAAAFLPVYTQLDRDDPATARRLASLTVATLVESELWPMFPHALPTAPPPVMSSVPLPS